jgi:hypothetical protein
VSADALAVTTSPPFGFRANDAPTGSMTFANTIDAMTTLSLGQVARLTGREYRHPFVPISILLVSVRDLEHPGLGKRAALDLEPDGQAFAVKPTRHAHGREPHIVDGPRDADVFFPYAGPLVDLIGYPLIEFFLHLNGPTAKST